MNELKIKGQKSKKIIAYKSYNHGTGYIAVQDKDDKLIYLCRIPDEREICDCSEEAICSLTIDGTTLTVLVIGKSILSFNMVDAMFYRSIKNVDGGEKI